MKVRGQRECTDCGARWSYFETGEVSCPDCGSLRSVGVADRERHTDAPVTLDLTEHRNVLDDEARGVRAIADDLKSTLREYRRRRGFINGGSLRPLDDTYLAAGELLQAVDVFARQREPTDDEQLYVLSLLGGADRGERPPADEVPSTMTAARGLAAVDAVEEYRSELQQWLDDHPDAEARRTLETVRDQVRRAQALQGDIPLDTAEALVTAMREVHAYLTEDDLDALAAARDRLSSLN